MNTAEAVRLISLLEEVAGNSPSESLHASIAQVLEHLVPCIPADQREAFERFRARGDYTRFLQRMRQAANEPRHAA